jgi:protein-disulfide isomerase
MRRATALPPRLVLLLLLLAAAPACGQATPQDEEARAGTRADSVAVRADSSRYRGDEHAPITIYEFSDFQCPFCREYEMKTAAAVDSALVQTGRARLVYFNFPLPIHPNAWVAAEAAMCAGAQGKFWPMHERLFREQEAWATAEHPGELFARYAGALGLDASDFQSCTREDQVSRVIIQDLAYGAGGGLRGTPTFVILRDPAAGENPQDTQRVLSGAVPLEDFLKAIEEITPKE